MGQKVLFKKLLQSSLYCVVIIFSSEGGHHQAKAGQRPQEDSGAQGQISC